MNNRPKQLGHGSGSDFIARIDLETAAERFRDTLEAEAAAHSDVTSDVFEVAGAIKWFDASKGYGFIVPDTEMLDVLLGVHDLRDEVDPSQSSDEDTNLFVDDGQWVTASVSSFDAEQGFELLALGSQSPPIYCHIETARRGGFLELKPGQLVQIRYGQGERGPTVTEMRSNDESLW